MIRAAAIAGFALACSSPGATVATRVDDDCASCHAEIAAEWRSSRHAVAFTNELFTREFSSRRTAWCATCHAPSAADPMTVRDDDPAARRGVDCIACHGRDGVLVSRRRSARSPHITRVDPGFGSPADCATCHEFEFPLLDDRGMHAASTGVPMQQTVSQFAASDAARQGKDCGSCHQQTPAGHRFPGSHDPDMLRGAVSLQLCRHSGGEIAVVVANRRAAHNVPTGGVHRHMIVRAWRSTAPENLWQVYIGRRFESLGSGGKRPTLDSTIPPGSARSWNLDPSALGGQADEPIRVELRYVYVEEGSAPVEEIERLSRTIHSESVRSATLSLCE